MCQYHKDRTFVLSIQRSKFYDIQGHDEYWNNWTRTNATGFKVLRSTTLNYIPLNVLALAKAEYK